MLLDLSVPGDYVCQGAGRRNADLSGKAAAEDLSGCCRRVPRGGLLPGEAAASFVSRFFSCLHSWSGDENKTFQFQSLHFRGNLVRPGNGQLNDVVGLQMSFVAKFLSQSGAGNVDYYQPTRINSQQLRFSNGQSCHRV